MSFREAYIDNGLSGQSFERPAFRRMIADMESGKINCCIVKDLSRLGRNAIDSGYYIEKYFPSNNVRFVAITDNYDSADGQSGGIMVSLKNMINEAYALDISRKVRATVETNINNGCFVGGTAPYGYLKSRDDCHKLVPDEYAAGIVRHIFEMAAEGYRANAILEWLNGNEILTPKHYWHSIGLATEKEVGAHTHWSFRAVRDILSNRIYCGDMVQGKRRTAGSIVKKLPKSEWVITENTHEAIISREMFAAVQELWKKPDKPTEPYYKAPRTENLFPQKVFCGDCGFAMIRKRNGEKSEWIIIPGKHPPIISQEVFEKVQEIRANSRRTMRPRDYLLRGKVSCGCCGFALVYGDSTFPATYRCMKTHADPTSDCHKMKVNADELEDAVMTIIKKQAEVVLESGDLSGLRKMSDFERRIAECEKQIRQWIEQRQIYYEQFVQGEIDRDTHMRLKSECTIQLDRLNNQLALLKQMARDKLANQKAVAFANKVVDESLSHKDIVDALIDKIHVFPGNHIEIQWKVADFAAKV